MNPIQKSLRRASLYSGINLIEFFNGVFLFQYFKEVVYEKNQGFIAFNL